MYLNLLSINHLYILFVKISYQARFCPAILFPMLMGFLNHGSFIIHALLPGTNKAFTLLHVVFMPGACIHVLLPGTQNIDFHVCIHTDIQYVSWEPEGRYCRSAKLRWEPEGCYCHWLCTVIAPFWFSTEHLWAAITPFWLSTDE